MIPPPSTVFLFKPGSNLAGMVILNWWFLAIQTAMMGILGLGAFDIAIYGIAFN